MPVESVNGYITALKVNAAPEIAKLFIAAFRQQELQVKCQPLLSGVPVISIGSD